MASRWLLFFAVAMLAMGQRFGTKRPIHIDGTVIEKESRAPIPNAKVMLVATENSDEQRTTSDANGRFSFDTIEPAELGLPLQVRAEAPGYLPALPDIAGGGIAGLMQSSGGGALQIARDKSNYVAELNLSRAATLSGVLIDLDSKRPLAKLTVTAQRRVYRRGDATYDGFGGAMPAVTGADGSFHFDGLVAGDYALLVQDPVKPKVEALPAGKLPATPEGSLGYGTVILPGATADYPEFASIPLRAGATVDIGKAAVRQQRLRNFAGTIDSDCKDSERVTLVLTRPIVTSDAGGEISCGPFLISNVPEGAFTVGLHIMGGQGAGYVSQPLDLRPGETLHLRVQPRGPIKVLLEVEETPAGEFPKDLEGLFVGFNPKTAPNFQENLQNKPAVNLKVEGFVFAGATYELQLARLPESYYVKRVFYNDVEQPDSTRFTTSPGVLNHALRIVLSKHPATFQAQVDAGNTVLLMRDELDAARRYAERMVLTPAPSQKSVSKRGLRPGSYHAFAIPTASLPGLEVPGGIDQYLRKAEAVHLEEGQTAIVPFN